MKRGFFTWAMRILLPRQGEPIQPKKTTTIYLFLRNEGGIVSHDLWIDSKQTQRTLTLKEIRKILSGKQYAEFILQGIMIFDVPVDNLRKYIQEPTRIRKKVDNGDFTSGPHNR